MASQFSRELNDRNPDPEGRRWVFVPYDQLSDQIGPLAHEDPEELGIVLVEAPAKARRRPYHRQKIALVLANLRHFALEQAARGVAVRHVVSPGSGYGEALEPLVDELGPLRCMEPAERELRMDLAPLVDAEQIEIVPHEGWLTEAALFSKAHKKGPPWRMDTFYRAARRELDVLMDENGKPVGGKFSFDAENRRRWSGDPPAPQVPGFEPDAVTAEVLDLVADAFGDHPGTLDGETLPATAEDAERVWAWALDSCLPTFGPYQDAMAAKEPSLFHTRISALVHLHRLLPRRVVEDALAADIPLASQEGFVRQVLGWREFVRHVHRETDGFRSLPEGYGLRRGEPLPKVFWGGAPSGMRCLDSVVDDVWREGYGHHITRLMVLSNVATLLDISPRELSDWFWVAYTDAYDWVVEPNVLGMGTYGVGDLMTTKPYVSGSAYIDKMSDYCGGCAFDPKKDCPIRSLYWAWLDRHADALRGNHRLNMPLASCRKRSDEQRADDRRVFEATRSALCEGARVR